MIYVITLSVTYGESNPYVYWIHQPLGSLIPCVSSITSYLWGVCSQKPEWEICPSKETVYLLLPRAWVRLSAQDHIQVNFLAQKFPDHEDSKNVCLRSMSGQVCSSEFPGGAFPPHP